MKYLDSVEKAKRTSRWMPIGTVSRGRKKVAEGKWVPVKTAAKKTTAKPKIKPKTKPKEKIPQSSKEFTDIARDEPLKNLKIFKNAENTEWSKKPGMLGEIWAKASILFAEKRFERFVGDKRLKDFIHSVVRSESDNYRYFSNLTDNYIKTVAIVINRIRMGKDPLKLYRYAATKTGMIRNDLDKVLEYGAYVHDPDGYIDYGIRGYMFYGMSKEDSTKRVIDRMKKFEKENPDKVKVVKAIWGRGENKMKPKKKGAKDMKKSRKPDGPWKGPVKPKTSTKSKIPYQGHSERMKFAKMAAERMLPRPEGVKDFSSGTVGREGRVPGEKSPYDTYSTSVSGMRSSAVDNNTRNVYLIKPSDLGSSAPESPRRHIPKKIKTPRK